MKVCRLYIAMIFASTLSLASGIAAADSPRNTPIVKVIKECAPSVVNISTERVVMVQQNPFWGLYGGQLNDFFEQHSKITIGTAKLKGVGSGVIVSKEGLIVTNAHVINMVNKIYVVLYDGATYDAELVAVDPRDDLALIKIGPSDRLRPIEFAGDVIIGETVVSIGNPFGLENSVSAGIVSGTNRNFSSPINRIAFEGLIQTDASINPGSSGGALLNLEGKLIGVNLAVVQNAQSIGFAISVEKIKGLLRKYEEYKEVKGRQDSENITRIPVQ